VGRIFQGRYKSILVEDDRDGLKLSASIRLNPVSSGFIVSKNKEDIGYDYILRFGKTKL